MAGAARVALVSLGLFALLAAMGCYNNNTGETVITQDIHFTLPAFPETGSNKVQIFTEMHYQQSYRSQEGPRLDPPESAVPITGKEVSAEVGGGVPGAGESGRQRDRTEQSLYARELRGVPWR